ncbi:hypothetical protein EMIT047CA2_100079 [Pseudomonas soli]
MWFSESGVGVDESAEHFIGSLGDLGTQFDFVLAQGQLHGAGGQIHLLAAVNAAQTLCLVVAGLPAGATLDGAAGDLLGGLVDPVLPVLDGTQARVEGGTRIDFHVRTP